MGGFFQRLQRVAHVFRSLQQEQALLENYLERGNGLFRCTQSIYACLLFSLLRLSLFSYTFGDTEVQGRRGRLEPAGKRE